MNAYEIIDLATEIMGQYGLIEKGWTAVLDSGKRRAGQCRYNTREISLSQVILPKASDADVRETILHEVAHALTPGHQHDSVWRQKLISMGGTGRRTHSMETPKGRYELVCVNCGVVGHRHQKSGNLKYATLAAASSSYPMYTHKGCGKGIYLRDTGIPAQVKHLVPKAPTAVKIPVAASNPAPKNPNAPTCYCRCGGNTKGGKYLPGHDARHVSEIFARWIANEFDLEGAVQHFADSPKLAVKLTNRIAAHAAKNYKG